MEPSGAGSTGGSVVAGANTGGGGSPAAGVGGGAGMPALPDTSGELYDPEQLPRFDIDLPPASVDALAQDPDVYVRGTLRYAGETVPDIGVRIKGEGSLRTLQEKAAFKLKFDEFVSKQSFHGLRRMTFNNMVEDPSFLAERLAFHFFRELGLPAPRCNSALLYVNGEFFGLYANVETEDKTFLRRWFESDAGNLYEEGQVDFDPGNENAFDLETNEEKNDRSDLTALIAAVAGAEPTSFVEDVGSELDMEHFLAFTAAEAAVNQWDMYGYTVFYPNNFRLYRDPTRQKFVMLPWGMDMSMKPYRDSGKPHIEVLELARQYDQQNGMITAGRILRGCLTSPTCKAAYVKVVEATAARYETAGLEALAKKYYEQVKSQIAADPRKEYTSAQVQTGYESLLRTIRERPAAMLASLQP
jgi:spore coat protein CotH